MIQNLRGSILIIYSLNILPNSQPESRFIAETKKLSTALNSLSNHQANSVNGKMRDKGWPAAAATAAGSGAAGADAGGASGVCVCVCV